MVVGIDGCPAGWFAVGLHPDNTWNIHVFATIQDVWDHFNQADLILIDIPIGLREAGHQERQCDIEARQHLGWPRRTSVFPVPCRQATYANNRVQADDINRRIANRGIAPMTWGIIPKIHQVDMFLLANQPAQNVIREVHPEVCFWSLADHQPMQHRKKSDEGHVERMDILQQHYPNAPHILDDALQTYYRNQVKRDDIVDAMVAAITARMVMHNVENNILVHALPVNPEFDPQGLRMEMLYAL